jgi:hypothetical protein
MSVEIGDDYVYIDHGERLLRIRRGRNGRDHHAEFVIDLFTDKGRSNFHVCMPEEAEALERLLNGAK